MAATGDNWSNDKAVARAMLRDRTTRRKLIARLLIIALVLMAGGLWVIDGWLAISPWRFLLWWGACAIVTCGMFIFALYVALAVIREEREKGRGGSE